MDETVFDGTSFVSINLNTGQISTPGQDRLTLVSSEILSLVPPSEALHRAAVAWGGKHGKNLKGRVALDAAGVEALSTHLGGTLAALGMGRISLEIRHSALVFRMRDEPSSTVETVKNEILPGFLVGYLEAVSGYPFDILNLEESGEDRMLWAGNPDAVAEVRRSMEKGMSSLAAIDALMTGEAAC